MLAEFRLGDKCTKIGSGATPRGGSSVYLTHGEIALIRSQNIYNEGFRREGLAFITSDHAAELSNVTVMPGDVLLNITGDSVARCCQVDESALPARVNQHVAIIRPDPQKLDPRFLRYCLVSPQMQARMLSWAGSGGTRNALTKEMIESLPIRAPSKVPEQQAVANVLGTLDDKIELNRRMNETLEAMARAIFKSWFVNFDPVRAKLALSKAEGAEGRQPFGMDAATAALFPDSFQDSPLGKIPKGWSVGEVADLGSVVCGKTPPTSEKEFYGGEVPFITIPDIRKKIFITETARQLSEKGAQHQASKTIPGGSICVSCIATPGLVAITSEPAQTNQQINSVIPHDSSTTYYCYWVLRGLADEIRAAGSGGSVTLNLNKGQFAALPVLRAPETLTGIYQAVTDPLFSRILLNVRESRTLAIIRDALLPKLISGEIRIKNAERPVEAKI